MTLRNKKIEERGITLIALVITIIVLLILAGVALSALTGDSGILNNAESAKGSTNLANAKEQVALAVQGALTRGYAEGIGVITRDNLKNELENIVGQEGKDYTLSEGDASWTIKVGEYETLVHANCKTEQNGDLGGTGEGRDTITLPSATGTTPWLPAGFSQVKDTNLATGLTIANTSNGTPGTQNYVWIEVPTTIEEEIIVEVDGVFTTKTVKLSNTANIEEIAAVLEAYVGDYAKGSSSQDNSSWKDEWYDSNGNTIASDRSNKNDTAGCGMTYEQYQTAYSDMLKSIKIYGGFWLAQYEAGILYEQGNRTSASARIETPASANYAKNKYPYNWVYCSEAQKIANKDSTEEYTSSLPFGIQWDLVCKFLELKGAKTYDEIARNSIWGNYDNIGWTSIANSKYSDDYGYSFKLESKTKSSGSYLLTTGAIEKNIYDSTEHIANPMNIYDFAGNVWEYTLEYTARSSDPCAGRGGIYNGYSYLLPAAYRTYHSTTGGGDHFGFRSTLY